MFGSSWCHHCHELFPSVYEISKKVGASIERAAETIFCLPSLAFTHILFLQFPKTNFVVAQMDYMNAAVKVRLLLHV